MDIFEEICNRKQTWYMEMYWAAYRFLKYRIGTPKTWCRKAKWFYQRGKRGWADCDVWSFDDYLARVIADGLEHLAKTTHGYPANFSFKNRLDGMTRLVSVDEKDHQLEKWCSKLLSMAGAFRAYQRSMGEKYDDVIGPFPKRIDGESQEARTKRYDEYFEKLNIECQKDYAIFLKGAKEFIKHFHNLWD